MQQFTSRILMAGLMTSLFLIGCGDDWGEPAPLRSFESADEFDGYMSKLAQARTDAERGSLFDLFGGSGGDYHADSAPSEPINENITNNQEEGVDEGGIVKNIGDHLVILRQGRLYTVRVADSGESYEKDSIRVAPTTDLNGNVWYDEMLVKGSRIYVVGFRYLAEVVDSNDKKLSWIHGATEISSFILAADGSLTRGQTIFLESNDYYSGRNYASRLVNGELVFYMPFQGLRYQGNRYHARIPRLLEHVAGSRFRAVGDLFHGQDVVRPITPPNIPVFHTLMQCELPEDGSVDCKGRSLLGEPSREFYVSRDNVFLWTAGRVYMMSQTDSTVKAHSVRGSPVDQFSFREDGQVLHVATIEYVQPKKDRQREEGHFLSELLTLPLADFDSMGKQSLGSEKVRSLPLMSYGWSRTNRYVDGWYIMSIGGPQDGRLLAHRIADAHTEVFEISYSVQRIEAMAGIGALIVGQDSTQLQFETLLLRDEPTLVTALTLQDTAQGESRSHGFFFKPNDGGGLFGLPVLGNSSGGDGWWGTGASNIAFFSADRQGGVDLMGTISNDGGTTHCETSCIDWYGNTRPIFLRDRIYALMGSEFAEVAVDAGTVEMVGDYLLLGADL